MFFLGWGGGESLPQIKEHKTTTEPVALKSRTQSVQGGGYLYLKLQKDIILLCIIDMKCCYCNNGRKGEQNTIQESRQPTKN